MVAGFHGSEGKPNVAGDFNIPSSIGIASHTPLFLRMFLVGCFLSFAAAPLALLPVTSRWIFLCLFGEGATGDR